MPQVHTRNTRTEDFDKPKTSVTDNAYTVRDHRLYLGDEELLAGSANWLSHFAAVLNAASPIAERVAPTLKALIGTTVVCGFEYSFAPGSRLMAYSPPVPLKRGSK